MASANGFGHLAGDLVSHGGRWPLGDWGGTHTCVKMGSCCLAPPHYGRVAGFSGDSMFHLGRKRQMFFKEKNSLSFYRLAVTQNCLKHCAGPTKRVCW